MKNEILKCLKQTDGYVSGQELCERLGVSRTAVWKVIRQLEAEGYEIEAVRNRGYRLHDSADILNEAEIRAVLTSRWLGQNVKFFEEIDSTNNEVRRMAEQGAPEGTLVVAENQTAGKGRRGRAWIVPAGIAIAMSIVLKPQELLPEHAPQLTLVAALAVARAIEQQTGLSVQIKWPNDIVIDGKKVCGILTEMSTQIDYINHIVVGIGINVHNEQFPEELSDRATSLYLSSGGRRYSRAALVEAVCEQFEYFYGIFMQTQDMSGLKEVYDDCLVNRGRTVRILDPKGEYEGVALGISPQGALEVNTADGRRLVDSGEVSVRGVYGYV